MDQLVVTLKRDATMCLAGIRDVRQANQLPLVPASQRAIALLVRLSMEFETQEVVDFCNLHDILPEYKLVKSPQLNQVWNDAASKKARYRYVLDLRKA